MGKGSRKEQEDGTMYKILRSKKVGGNRNEHETRKTNAIEVEKAQHRKAEKRKREGRTESEGKEKI